MEYCICRVCDLAILLPATCRIEKIHICAPKGMGKGVHSSIMCNRPKLETIQRFSSSEMDKLLQIEKLNGLLHSSENEPLIAIHIGMTNLKDRMLRERMQIKKDVFCIN